MFKLLKRYRFAILLLLVGGVLCLGYAYFIEPERLVVREVRVPLRGWNPAFNNFRIVALSDVHGGSNGGSEANIRRIVETVNRQNADAVVILGDFVSEEFFDRKQLKMPVRTIAEALGGLRAKHGVFAVLGNHDAAYSDEIVAGELRRAGLTVLVNEVAVIKSGDQQFRFFGMEDHIHTGNWGEFAQKMKNSLAATEGQGDLIALEHGPDLFPVLTDYILMSKDLRLMISGHTHGGQVWLPIIKAPIIPSIYGQKYAYGQVRAKDADLYVTSGTGTSLLPFRFGVPPEIAVLELVREEAE